MNTKIIFRITGKVPLLQVISLLLLGSIALYLSLTITVGEYEGIEVSVTQVGTEYLLNVSEEDMLLLNKSIEIHWSCNQLTGKKYEVKEMLLNGRKQYALSVENIAPTDQEQLEGGLSTVYLDCKIKQQKMIDLGGKDE